ncbi:MAG: MBL fold metallo-hydrolase [Spirochaetaceae bacterium]|nr:MAG: MBL fold metallo-hydrolase [Spirochaetaceae bacterium]
MKLRAKWTRPLALHNQGQLSLFFIGCGSAFARSHYQNNLLIIEGDDHVMVDCGTRAPLALSELGLGVTTVRNWLITHSHADHIGGLEEVMLMNRYGGGPGKPTIAIAAEYQRLLWGRSLRGGCELNETSEGLRFEDFWNIRRPRRIRGLPRNAALVRFGNIELLLFRTRHFPEHAAGWSDSFYSVGMIVNQRILFTGDTQFDPDLLHIFQELYDIETIFHDVQFRTGGVHASFEDLVALPQATREKMVLMHYPDTWMSHRERAEQAGMRFARQHCFYDFS